MSLENFDAAELLPQKAPYLQSIEQSLGMMADNSTTFMQWLKKQQESNSDKKALLLRLKKLGEAMTLFLKNCAANQETRHVRYSLHLQNVQDALDAVMACFNAETK